MTGITDSWLLRDVMEGDQKGTTMPPPVLYYGELLRMQNEAKSQIIVQNPDITSQISQDRLSMGVPLLQCHEFSPDVHQVQRLIDQVIDWASKDSEAPLSESRSLKLISHDLSLLARLVQGWYLRHSSRDEATEDVDHELLNSIITATMKPFLASYASLLSPYVQQQLWRRRYCPVCGSKPDFVYLDMNSARWLVCCRCDAEWLYVRLECPYCGSQNQNSLAYFTDEGQPSYRLYVCEDCHTYIKAVDLRHSASVVFPLERVMTLGMDKQAQEKGYRPGV